ncbi:MAG: hypothetical protein LBN27_13370, partial [Prevotellaceae bacterium]|nr:hypothetical protein [Prevotellaceae bacterium]
MKKSISTLILLLPFITINAQEKIIANPLNLNYRFQASTSLSQQEDRRLSEVEAYREAADPEIHLFKDKYYLFASHSGGYWRSNDLAEWTYIPCQSIAVIGNYAPTVLNLNDTLYYMASGSPRIFFTANPDNDEWQELQNNRLTIGETDPAFFRDDDGRV